MRCLTLAHDGQGKRLRGERLRRTRGASTVGAMTALALVVFFVAPTALAVEPGTVLPTAPNAVQRAVAQAACSGEYADAVFAESAAMRAFEREPAANFSYCLRNTATYECLFYGDDGKVHKKHVDVTAHGTAFAYRVQKNGETLLLTNDHVATWPAVTDDDDPVEGVPNGCKKVEEQLHIVKDEDDDYRPGWIAVQKVVSDPVLDAAVVKTRAHLNVMPYRIGRSGLLRVGNFVEVRGYPLGLLEATNTGKVVDAYDLDRENGWYHTDFLTDALLTKGNSGSPVLAISCRTGEPELVGIYHAGYRDSPALNAVVGIDQLHALMDHFTPSPPPPDPDEVPPGPKLRVHTLAWLAQPTTTPLFPLGDRTARVRRDKDGTLYYDIFADDFPSSATVSVSLKESPAGQLVAFSANVSQGSLPWMAMSTADAQTQDVARKLYALVREQVAGTLAYRAALPLANSSRGAFKRSERLASSLYDHEDDANDLIKKLEQIAGEIASGARGTPAPARAVAQLAARVLPPAPGPSDGPDGGTPPNPRRAAAPAPAAPERPDGGAPPPHTVTAPANR